MPNGEQLPLIKALVKFDEGLDRIGQSHSLAADKISYVPGGDNALFDWVLRNTSGWFRARGARSLVEYDQQLKQDFMAVLALEQEQAGRGTPCARPVPLRGIAPMESTGIFEQSDAVADRLLAVIDLPLMDQSSRIRTSDVACSLALEHWSAARALLRAGLLPSALVVHRAQFEALVRSIWLAYVASAEQVAKLSANTTWNPSRRPRISRRWPTCWGPSRKKGRHRLSRRSPGSRKTPGRL